MPFSLWCLVIGGLLILMALAGTLVRRIPLSTAMLYLAVGLLLSPACFNLWRIDVLRDTEIIELIAEVALLISLFTAGLKLRLPLKDPQWWLSIRLAVGAMVLTIGLITVAGVSWLGLTPGAALLLGAILAPTDPVLASDVQVSDAKDTDSLRFTLTGEAGLNDGTAFPFVYLGLGLLGLYDLGAGGWRWIVMDVVYSVGVGILVGSLLGTLIGRLVLFLRQKHKEAIGLDDFLALGLMALSYGVALTVQASGFLAVFAAGLALRRIERAASGSAAPPDVVAAAAVGNETLAAHPRKAPAYMAQAVLGFNEQLERLGEVAVVLLLGALLHTHFSFQQLGLVLLLFFVIRPISVLIGTVGSTASRDQRFLMSWFGVRGVGSVYYLAFAIRHGLPEPLARTLIDYTFTAVAFSIVVHGISVTPMMKWYKSRASA